MESKKERILSLIKSGAFSAPLSEDFPKALSPEEEALLFQASAIQDLTHIVGTSLKNNHIALSEEGEKKFQKQIFLAYYRYEKIKYELNRLKEALSDAKIPFVPLKGSVLREYYPEPWMRTSCDIDLFVQVEDLERASGVAIERLGFTLRGQWKGERAFSSQAGVTLELHFFDEEDDEEGRILREIWEHVSASEDEAFCMKMEWEYFYLHHIAHMAKHFSHGGCGIRPFLDLAVMKRYLSFDQNKVGEYLKKYGFTVFAQTAEHLSEVWFGEAMHTPLTRQMHEYILGAGIYGSITNQVALEKGGKSKLLGGFSAHIWLPYDVIKHQFPVLLRHQWLTPFCQVARWFKLLFCGGLRHSLEHLRANRTVSDEKVTQIANLMDQLELT